MLKIKIMTYEKVVFKLLEVLIVDSGLFIQLK
jgi:hypothetical protein